MQNKKVIVVFVWIFVCFSCQKEKNKVATLLRDCTGTYVRYNEKDYRVCNLEKTNSFSDSSIVKITFKKISVCEGSAKDQIVCMMARENDGWIEVLSIE